MIQCDLLFLMVEELMIGVYDIIYIGKLIKKIDKNNLYMVLIL